MLYFVKANDIEVSTESRFNANLNYCRVGSRLAAISLHHKKAIPMK